MSKSDDKRKAFQSADIATRLRESNGMTTSRSSDGFMSIHPDTDLMREAADEIERLRAEVARLGSFLHPIGTELLDRRYAVLDEPRRVADTLGGGQYVDAPFGGNLKDIHAACHSEVERLRALVVVLGESLEHMTCQNCDDRKCMDCVCRAPHDVCVEDCMECLPQERVHGVFVERYTRRDAALEEWRAYRGR